MAWHYRIKAPDEKVRDPIQGEFSSTEAIKNPADGLVKKTATGLEVTDSGRLFIRNIAMCFDNTLGAANERRHSKTI